MQGIITIQARNAETLELILEKQQKNIITEAFIRNFLENVKPYFTLQVTNASMKSSVYSINTLSASGALVVKSRDEAIFGVGLVTFIPRTDTQPAILQYSGRFLPPAAGSTREIKSIMLSGNSLIQAFAELAVPCVQTSSEVYLSLIHI